jgi:hypothetical protein
MKEIATVMIVKITKVMPTFMKVVIVAEMSCASCPMDAERIRD